MVVLELDNVYLSIRGLAQDDENELWGRLAFQVEVFGQEPRTRHLFNRRTKKTYAGLTPDVLAFLKEKGVDYTFTDNRVHQEPNADFHLVETIDTDDGPVKLEARPYQREIIDNARPREVIQAATGAGKAMPLDTPILTPAGFRPLADVHVGDQVFDERGVPVKVLAEYPQGLKDEYEVTFRDGSSARCCGEHLWKYVTRDDFGAGGWRVDTLAEIAGRRGWRMQSSNGAYKVAIPVCGAIQFPHRDLPIPPYLLGALLGDGGLTGAAPTFTNPEEDVVAKVCAQARAVGGEFHRRAGAGEVQWFLTGALPDNRLKAYLRTLGEPSARTKFVPREYLLADVEARLELVRGLVDTDGSVDDKGHVRFATVSRRLAEDLQFLVRSLGYRASLTVHERTALCGVPYAEFTVRVASDDDRLFTSAKHRARFAARRTGKPHRYDLLKVADVRPTGRRVEMKCIAVDGPAHTFICNDFLVTHNTFIMAGLIAKFNVKPVAVFADKITLCEQLQAEFSKFLGTPVGLYGGGQDVRGDITVYSLQSVTEADVKDAAMIMFDECVVGSTLVTMADGTRRRMDDLFDHCEHGAAVAAYDGAQVTARAVRRVCRKPLAGSGKRVVRLRVDTLDAPGHAVGLDLTDDHKVFTDEEGYVPVAWLTHAHTLRLLVDGRAVPARLVSVDPAPQPEYVYDVTVDVDHNFFANAILVKNCHHIPAQTCINVCNMAKNAYYRVGVSATPWRDAGDDMLIDAALNRRRPEGGINASRLIELGYLVKPRIFFVPVKQVFTGRVWQKVYTAAVVENTERNLMIRKIVKQMFIRDRHILVLVQQVKHGEVLQELITAALGGDKYRSVTVTRKSGRTATVLVHQVEFMSGSDGSERRQAVINSVKDGFTRVLIATVIADEGLDLPILDTLVLAGGGKSSTRAFQRVGRVLRLYPGKQGAVVFDMEDFTPMLRRHARVRRRLYKTEPAWEIGKFNVSPYDSPQA